MFKKLILSTIWKESVSFVKKYWYIISPLLSLIMATITSFFGWASWFFGLPAVIWYGFLLGLLILALLRLFYCLMDCAYSNWKIQKEIDKIEKDKEVYIEKAQFDHNNKINQIEKESELRIKESSYEVLVIPYQKRVAELAILLPQSENPNQIMHEISVYLKLSPLIQMDGVLEIAKSLGIDNPTPNQKSVIKEVLERYDVYQDEICDLFNKILQKIKIDENVVSKQTVQFLDGINKDKLQIIKKQFMYIISNGINYFNYNNNKIQEYLASEGLMSHSYSLEFYGDIYKDEAVSGITPKVQTYMKSAFTFYENVRIQKHTHVNVFAIAIQHFDMKIICIIEKTQFELEKNDKILEIPMYVMLTDVGRELYNVLKDDIQNAPIPYLKHIIRGVKNKYKQYKFLLSKP